MADFEALNLKISADSSNATSSIDSLTASLQGLSKTLSSLDSASLKTITSSISRLAKSFSAASKDFQVDKNFAENISKGISSIAASVSGISEVTLSRMERVAAAAKTLRAAGIQKLKLSDTSEPELIGTTNDTSSIASKFSSGNFRPGIMRTLWTGVKVGAKTATASVKGLSSALAIMYRNFGLGNLASLKFIRTLGQVAKYSLLYRGMSVIIQGVGESFKSLAAYSNETAATFESLSSGTQSLRNNFAAALYPAIASLMGVFSSLINVVTRALNIVSMFFSVLGGRSTYIRAKATTQTKAFANANEDAASAASALKQELMAFDEINALSPSGGGGGGGGGGLDVGGMFEEVPVESWLADMIETGNFSALGATIADKINNALGHIDWSKIQSGAASVAGGIASAINGFIATISPIEIGNTIAGAINTGTLFVSLFWSKIDWKGLGDKSGESLMQALNGINAITLGLAISGKLVAMLNFLKGWVSGTGGAFFTTAGKKIGETLNAAISNLTEADVNFGQTIATLINDAAGGVVAFVTTTKWEDAAKGVMGVISDAFTNADADLIADAVSSVINAAARIVKLDETGTALTAVVNKVTYFLKHCFEGIEWGTVGEGLANIVNAITQGVSSALNSSAGESEKSAIKELIEGFFGNLDFKALLNFTFEVATSTLGKIALGIGIANMVKSSLATMFSSYLKYNGISAGKIGLSAAAAIYIIAELAENIGGMIKGQNFEKHMKELIVKVLFGTLAGFIAVGLGASGLVITIPVAIGVAIASIIPEGISQGMDIGLSDAIKLEVLGAEDSTTAAENLAAALSELTGVAISADAILSEVDVSYIEWAMSGSAEGVDALYTRLYALMVGLGLTETAIEKAETGMSELTGTTEEVATGVGEAATVIDDFASDTDAALSEANSSIADTQSNIDNLTGSVDAFNSTENSMPDVMVIDSSSFADIKTDVEGAAAALTPFVLLVTAAKAMLKGLNGLFPFSSVTNSATSASSEISTLVDSINDVPSTKSAKVSITNYSNSLSRLNALKNALASIKSKTITVTVKVKTETIAEKTAKSIVSSIKDSVGKYAQGGFPRSGDLFVANENGMQELVGRIGSQPAVANQDQIGEAIFHYMDAHAQQSAASFDEDRLATAIVRGMKAAGLGNLNVDGRSLVKAINRETVRRGKPAIEF